MTSCWQEWLVYWSATFAFVARELDKDLTADDWKCGKWKWVHTCCLHWNTQGHRFKRFGSFFRRKGIYWRLLLYWQQLYWVRPHEASVRLFPSQSCSWRHFWEMNMLMLTRAAQWRPCQTHSHRTRHCVVCVSHKSCSRGYGWLKGRCLHMYAVTASIAFFTLYGYSVFKQ